MKMLLQLIDNRKVFSFLVLGIAITIPLNQLMTSILSIGLIVFFMISFFFRKRYFSKKEIKTTIILSIPFFIYLFYFLLNDLSFSGSSFFIKKASLLFFPIVFSCFQINNNEYKKIFHYFIYGILISFTLCIFIAIYKNIFINEKVLYGVWGAEMTQRFYSKGYLINWPYYVYTELLKPIGFSPIYMGMYCVFGGVISLYLFLKSNKRRYLLMFSAILMYCILCSSRNALIVFLILTPVILLYNFRNRIKILIPLLILLFTCAFLVFNLPFVKNRFNGITNAIGNIFDSKNHDYQKDIGNERLIIWSKAVDLIKEKPYLGHNRNFYNKELKKVSENRSAHNIYIEATLLLGMLGLLLIFIFLFFCFRVSIINKNIIYFSFLVLFVFSGLTESLLNRQQGVIFFAFFNVLLFYKIAPINRI